jgi:D-threo-aldose 1-dehydrogenase
MTAFDRSNWLRPFGSTGITVSAVCMGGAQLGSMPELFGYEVTEEDAVKLVKRVLDSPIRFLDTSNGYAAGRSEQRIGRAIREYGGLPAGFVVSTKVDAENGDYSGERVRTSVRESMERLGIGMLPIVFLHDPEFHPFEMMTEPGGAVDALVDLRDSGKIGHIGVAGGDTREISRYVDLGVFEAVLVHNRWTLVDRSAGPLFDRAVGNGLAVLNAAVYGGGLLTNSAGGNGNYAYRPAPDVVTQAAAAMAKVCATRGTDLATAALRFSLKDPRITATITGFTKESTLVRTLDALNANLPETFWQEIEALTPAPEHWLDNNEPIQF